MASSLHAPAFAGPALANLDTHDIGDTHSQSLPDHMQQELDDLMNQMKNSEEKTKKAISDAG